MFQVQPRRRASRGAEAGDWTRGAQRAQEQPLPSREAVCARPGACCHHPPSLQPRRRAPHPARPLLPLSPPPPPLFFFSPSTWGYDAVSLGPRVMPRPLAWLMLMRRRRGGGQGRGASGQGSASQMSPGWKPGEGVLGSKSPRQAPGDGCAVGGTGSLFLPILGPIGVRPRSSLLGRRGAAAGSPQPGGRRDSRGL